MPSCATLTAEISSGASSTPEQTVETLADKAGVETDRAGRVPVNPDCTLAGHPEVFAIGDMVSLNKLPGVAQPALQEGRYVGKVIKKRLAGETNIKPFHYFDKGTMATIGYRSAVADAFGVKVTGFLAYVMWIFIHVLYLVGWGNRFGAIYTWARALWLSHNRGNRIIALDTARQEADADRTVPVRPPAILPRDTPPAAPPAPAAEEAIPSTPREAGSA